MLHHHIEDAFATPAEVRRLARLCFPKSLQSRGVVVERGPTGTRAEVPVEGGLLTAVVARLLGRLGLPEAPVATLRLRDCGVGQGHPPHHDDYVGEGRWLVATAVLYLDACVGGRTRFPRAGWVIEPQPGRAAFWLNLDAEGQVVPSALHDMEPVAQGRRRAVFVFAYASPEEVAAAVRAHPEGLLARLGAVDAARWPRPRTLHLVVTPSLPSESVALLHQAARVRRLAVTTHNPAHEPAARPVPAGDLLFCPATSGEAARLQRQLWQPGVVTFYRQARGPFAEVIDQLTLFVTLGLPVPRSERLPWVEPEAVALAIERLGGLPVVLKLGGGEGGAGVMRLDTFTSLLSVLEGMQLRGIEPLLQAHVPDAMHWRLVVVGDRVVAAYQNPLRADGFRSHASTVPADYLLPPPAGAEAVAVAAAQALQVGLAGVDVLAHPSGRLYLLEANFPCYFPQAQVVGGMDVAGPMVDWLLGQADQQGGISSGVPRGWPP